MNANEKISPLVMAVMLLAIVGFVLGSVGDTFQFALIGLWAYGSVNAWRVRKIFGVCAFVIAPLGLLIGAGSLWTGRNSARDIIGYFRK